MKNKIVKIEFLAWTIFAIPVSFIVFGIYSLYSVTNELGDQINMLFFAGPVFNIVICFFCSRFFVERAKRKLQEEEIARLRKRLDKEYPERLEELEG